MISLAVTSILIAAAAPTPLYDVTYTFSPAAGLRGEFVYHLKAYVDGQEATIDLPAVVLSASAGLIKMDLNFSGLKTTLREFYLGTDLSELQQHTGTVQQAGFNALRAPFALQLRSGFSTTTAHGPFDASPDDGSFGKGYEDTLNAQEYNHLEGTCEVGGQTLPISVSLLATDSGSSSDARYFTMFRLRQACGAHRISTIEALGAAWERVNVFLLEELDNLGLGRQGLDGAEFGADQSPGGGGEFHRLPQVILDCTIGRQGAGKGLATAGAIYHVHVESRDVVGPAAVHDHAAARPHGENGAVNAAGDQIGTDHFGRTDVGARLVDDLGCIDQIADQNVGGEVFRR